MRKGNIGVTTENIFPIIKKFLYSDHEIFLREIVSNAVDASQKLKTLATAGEYADDVSNIKVTVSVDSKKKTITVSDNGIGMTPEEVDQYINQIAFSSANDFLEKYKTNANAIIGHFGLGFYSAFMVSEKVELVTKSYKEGSNAVKWVCDGSPEYKISDVKKDSIGTDVILYLDEESKDFAEESKVKELLTKYCKFLPVEIAFGKKKEWKDDKYVDTDVDDIINDPKPAWTKKPADLKDEDYKAFYKQLYPASYDDPLFNIHLNVDYPFNLTGILYFPKIRNNFEVQKNKIQLYCRQVFVTDSVEGIVPDFLTLLHGVLDSPDIPLNVSRSFLQSDQNVKKISSHITKKVADRLHDIFKSNREDFEKKWDDLKLFIVYGMITDEKFYERAKDFYLFKNADGKYFTMEEYENLIKENQKDKHNTIIYLYATNRDEQYTFIEGAKNKGYDVLMMDGHLDMHFINNIEPKIKDSRFTRVDADVIDKLIHKDDKKESALSEDQQNELRPVFRGVLPEKAYFSVVFEGLDADEPPVIITQSEYMRRMKDMSKMGGGQMGFYGDLPDNLNLVVNTNHNLILDIIEQTQSAVGIKATEVQKELEPVETELNNLKEANSKKKPEEIPQDVKDRQEELEKKQRELSDRKEGIFQDYGKENKLVKQVIDLALLANGMLKGEELTKFVKRSIELIGK
ncbi:MAG: molecular chaperone HtpG [Bacteroidetes bacterium RIFOXYB2_FULL_35_7]|nr:MAG: molecular chaperone HtpG [Bacteroidetes bacterium GWF2_35_48]OFY92971.1 MAG: molecular chaperone HtpG [Bacteroidetes bacterium RIFOXYC12_FULL_35_7]OFY94386.1 MAG: molecular chaperone HtpG [Bacteroidetes bacterium RIFOXYB2_FULL_35_7]HBX51610.1 molecular chaperone HtpG [Bacteroidales bacterium]